MQEQANAATSSSTLLLLSTLATYNYIKSVFLELYKSCRSSLITASLTHSNFKKQISMYYRIVGNFRGQADLHEILMYRRTWLTGTYECSRQQETNKFLLKKTTVFELNKFFTARKLPAIRFTCNSCTMDIKGVYLYYRGQLYVFPEGAAGRVYIQLHEVAVDN